MPWHLLISLSDTDDDSDTNEYDDDDDYHDDLICMYIFEKRSLIDIQNKWDKFYVDVRPTNYIPRVCFQI